MCVPRVAHFFRDVDLRSKSCPEFIPEDFHSYCQPDGYEWSAGFLLRVAVRMHHLWPTYGIRDGNRTIQDEHPAVCFANFSLTDLMAVRDGFIERCLASVAQRELAQREQDRELPVGRPAKVNVILPGWFRYWVMKEEGASRESERA